MIGRHYRGMKFEKHGWLLLLRFVFPSYCYIIHTFVMVRFTKHRNKKYIKHSQIVNRYMIYNDLFL